jgi:hypothetical protein
MAVKDELERLLKEYGELGKPWSLWCVEIDAKIEEAER